jgi:hypothetical protein
VPRKPQKSTLKIISKEEAEKATKLTRDVAIREAIDAGIRKQKLEKIPADANPRDIYRLAILRHQIKYLTGVIKETKSSDPMNKSARTNLKEEAKEFKEVHDKIFPHKGRKKVDTRIQKRIAGLGP